VSTSACGSFPPEATCEADQLTKHRPLWVTDWVLINTSRVEANLAESALVEIPSTTRWAVAKR
jgi:hypothetical protein